MWVLYSKRELGKDQSENDATEFVRKYRVGMKVIVRVYRVYGDNRAIGPFQKGFISTMPPPPRWRDSLGAAEARQRASCGRERIVGIDQWGAAPWEILDHLEVLQDVVSGQVCPWGVILSMPSICLVSF